MNYYLLFGTVALSSLIVKSLFLCFVPAHKLPSFFKKTLRYIPTSALAALIAPSIIYANTAGSANVSLPRVLAGVIAFFVAFKSRNLLFTLFSGMTFFWIFSRIISF